MLFNHADIKFSTKPATDLTSILAFKFLNRWGVLIFVRLRWYGVTGTPKRTNIGNQDSLGLWIPDSNYWIPDLFQWNLDSGFHKQKFSRFRIPLQKFSGFPYMGRKPPKIHPVRCERCARLRTSKNYSFDLTIHVGI